METEKKGKTLWEMMVERVQAGGNGSGIAFYNPLDLRVGSALRVAHVNGPEFSGYDFAVQEIREYNRRIGGQDFRFADYGLRGVNTMLSGVSAMVRPQSVGKQLDVPRTIADTLPLN